MAGIMGRSLQVREDYGVDATTVLRIRGAVSQDKSRPQEWRDKVAAICTQLASELTNAPPRACLAPIPNATPRRRQR